MKMINYKMAVAVACLSLWSAVRAEPVPANTIEAVTVAQQGNEIALKIDLKEPLSAPPRVLA